MRNKQRISLNKKILLIVLSIMVISQLTYLYIDVRSFEKSYVDIVRSNLYAAGISIRNNLTNILEKGIPINQLVGLEPLFNEILADAPNLSFLAIYDNSENCLYYSDRERFIDGEDAVKAGRNSSRFSLSFPLETTDGKIEGKLVTGIDQEQIAKQVRSIILDTGTIILISILATIDFLFFIIAFTIELPLKRAAADISLAKNPEQTGLSIRRTNIDFLDHALDQFDRHRYRFRVEWMRFNDLFLSFTRVLKYNKSQDPATYEPVRGIQSIISRFTAESKDQTRPVVIGSPVLIRPAVFLFVFAEALSISFLPLYAGEIYRPLWNLSREVIIGLPISAFMLFTALSFPVGGALADTLGYRKAFAIGATITATGLVLTGTANDILTLIIYRSIAGTGFGIVFITAQGYIVSTTSISNRAEGMAIFLSAFYGGTLCGAAIGGMVADRIGFRILFYSGAAITVISVLFIYFFITEQPGSGFQTGKKSGAGKIFQQFISLLPLPGDFIKLLSNRNFAALTLCQAIPNKICLIGFVYYLAPLFLKSLGSSQSDIGRYIMGYSLMMILFSQTVSKWSDRHFTTKPFIFWGGVLSGLSLIPFFFFTNTWMVAIGIIMLGLSHTISVSNQAKMASHLNAVKEIGVGPGLGVYRQIERLGNVIAPILLGVMSTTFGYSKTLALIGIFTVLSSIIFQVIYREEAVATTANLKT
ncbi:MAG: MFS transporter [Proteobacteria bacterium]|nr:MFS transporter [Pseudomonadota bacterium]